MLPAQSDRLSPALVVSNIFRTAFAVTLTALPVNRYFWLLTVPLMVNAPAFLAPASATTVAQASTAICIRCTSATGSSALADSFCLPLLLNFEALAV